MSQRRMPSGQGPAPCCPQSLAASRPRGAGPYRGGPRRPAGPPHAGRSGRDAGAAEARPGSGRRGRAARPGGIRRSAGAAARLRAPHPPRRLSRRATVLGLILLALALSYAYPLRVYLGQQADITRLEAGQRAQQARITELTERLSRWNDDDYVIAQARQRLHLVRPGEMIYIVGPAGTPADAGGRDGEQSSWLRQFWSNLQAADHPSG